MLTLIIKFDVSHVEPRWLC